jgi:hypothetical protein
MINLLEETLRVLKRNGKTPQDVLWVGDQFKKTTWDDFASIANFNYDNGFGFNEIESSLLIVGKDFWLEREEYDGSECWVYKEYPTCESDKFTKILDVKDGCFMGIKWGEVV